MDNDYISTHTGLEIDSAVEKVKNTSNVVEEDSTDLVNGGAIFSAIDEHIDNAISINPVDEPTTALNKLKFKGVVYGINGGSATIEGITLPDDTTSGFLSDIDYAKLTSSDSNYLFLDDNRYVLMEKNSTFNAYVSIVKTYTQNPPPQPSTEHQTLFTIRVYHNNKAWQRTTFNIENKHGFISEGSLDGSELITLTHTETTTNVSFNTTPFSYSGLGGYESSDIVWFDGTYEELGRTRNFVYNGDLQATHYIIYGDGENLNIVFTDFFI